MQFFGAGETKTTEMVCLKSELCRAKFCLAHPTSAIDRVDKIKNFPVTYKITYHYEPKYTYQGQTGPDQCRKSCSNPDGSSNPICVAWRQKVNITAPPPPEPPGPDWDAYMKYIAIGTVGIIALIVIAAVVVKKRRKKKK